VFAGIVCFFVSAIVTLLIVRSAHLHSEFTADYDIKKPQRSHAHSVPRVGGVGIAVGLLAGFFALLWRYGESSALFGLTLFACGMPAFLAGVLEDLTKRVGPLVRLIATMAAALIAALVLGAVVGRVDVPGLDALLAWKASADYLESVALHPLALTPIALIFTVVVVAGVANAVNIIDGLNGLAGMVSIMMFASIAYVAFRVNDATVLAVSLAMMGAIAGFFLLNFPAGLIFLGDGGAYFVGFMLAESAVLLVARNAEVSAWYAALLLIYPVWETIFSIYRRRIIRKANPGLPDGVHLHQLVLRRISRWAIGPQEARALSHSNSMSAPYLWVLSALSVFPASILWRRTELLAPLVVVFCVSYVWLYSRLVRFRTPRWLPRHRARAARLRANTEK
jgi:UDP-N-acetylmuramyl pentapeptide phosphotransferase/UDP-N-acetylglucosamine-1-phosphate transferase